MFIVATGQHTHQGILIYFMIVPSFGLPGPNGEMSFKTSQKLLQRENELPKCPERPARSIGTRFDEEVSYFTPGPKVHFHWPPCIRVCTVIYYARWHIANHNDRPRCLHPNVPSTHTTSQLSIATTTGRCPENTALHLIESYFIVTPFPHPPLMATAGLNGARYILIHPD
jgi:hypothetical protein